MVGMGRGRLGIHSRLKMRVRDIEVVDCGYLLVS